MNIYLCITYIKTTAIQKEKFLQKKQLNFSTCRVGIGASVATQLKHFVATATERNSRLTRFGRRLSEHPLMQRKVWRMAVNAYACESMAYMTAFQMDQEDEEGLPKDCSVEAAIVKVSMCVCFAC